MSNQGISFYVAGGTLRSGAPSYVERRADKDLFNGLLDGQFCYVLTARQMGKSSLMVRTANKLRDQGIQVIVLDLSAIGQNLTPEQWYNGLLTSMGDQLGLEDELEKNLSYLVTHQHSELTLIVHPILYAYLTKGGMFKSKLWKWRWRYKQHIKLKENTNYHLTEFHFFDQHEEEIKL